MTHKNLKENEFAPAPGGSAGTSNYQTGYGTHSSPDVSQNPKHFSNSTSVGNHSNTVKKVSNPADIKKWIDIIYSKPNPPTPDDIVAAIKRVSGAQIKKDPLAAKMEVLQKMAENPNAYRGLQDMNIDDKTMMDNVTENKHPNDAPARLKLSPNKEETSKIFTELADVHSKKYVVNSGIVDVMKEMRDKKRQRSDWKSGK